MTAKDILRYLKIASDFGTRATAPGLPRRSFGELLPPVRKNDRSNWPAVWSGPSSYGVFQRAPFSICRAAWKGGGSRWHRQDW